MLIVLLALLAAMTSGSIALFAYVGLAIERAMDESFKDWL